MDQKAVNRVSLNPSGPDESGYGFSWHPAPADPGLDFRIGILADIALWSKASRKVPYGFQQSDNGVTVKSKTTMETGEFRVLGHSA